MQTGVVFRRRGLVLRQVGADERESYDAAVTASPYGDLLQSFAWGELKREQGWTPLRFLIESEAAGSGPGRRGAVTVLRHGLPGTPWGFFYIPRGPAIDFGDRTVVVFIRDALAQLARRHRAVFARLDPPLPDDREPAKTTLRRYGFVHSAGGVMTGGTQPRAVWRLPIDKSLEDLRSNLAKDHRYFVRRAQRSGVAVREGGRDDLPLFHGLLAETAKRKGFPTRSLGYFQAMWRHLRPGGNVRLFISEGPDGPLAAVLLGVMGDQAWGLYQGTSNQHRNLGPSYYLIWEMITRLAGEGFTLFDLGGVDWKPTADSGLEHFKAGFGGSRVEYIGDYDYVFRPALYALWRKAFRARQRAVLARLHLRATAGVARSTVRSVTGSMAGRLVRAATEGSRSLLTRRKPGPTGPPAKPAG